MSIHSIPHEPRILRATEQRLDRIYDAARLGLKGDALALNAGMLPTEFRQLCEFDPRAAMAEAKGRADAEASAARTLETASRAGDVKAAEAILRFQHGWVAKQQIDVSIDQRISITAALEQARTRVIEGLVLEQAAEHPLLEQVHAAE